MYNFENTNLFTDSFTDIFQNDDITMDTNPLFQGFIETTTEPLKNKLFEEATNTFEEPRKIIKYTKSGKLRKKVGRKKANRTAAPPKTDYTRQWSLSNIKETYKSNSVCKLLLKTRLEEYSSLVPSNVYSSLCYNMSIHLTLKKDEFTSSIKEPFYIAKISLKDAETHEDVVTDLKNNPVFRGEDQCSLSSLTYGSDTNGEFKGKIGFKIGDLSYHHKRSYYYFVVRVFPSSNLNDAIMEFKCPSFRIYARKPNQPKKNTKKKSSTKNTISKKRKASEDIQEEVKRSKIEEFNGMFSSLFELHQSLDKEQQIIAFDLIREKLLRSLN